MKTQKQKLFEMFVTYYDVGLDNCFMTHEDWISNIVDALTDDKYLEKMMVFFKGEFYVIGCFVCIMIKCVEHSRC